MEEAQVKAQHQHREGRVEHRGHPQGLRLDRQARVGRRLAEGVVHAADLERLVRKGHAHALLLGRDDGRQVRRVFHAHGLRRHDLAVLGHGVVAVHLHVVHAAHAVQRDEGSAVQQDALRRGVFRRLHVQHARERIALLVDGVVLKARRVVDRGGHVLRHAVLAGDGDVGDVVKLARCILHGERVHFHGAAVRERHDVADHDVGVFLLFKAEHQRRGDDQQQHAHVRDERAVQAERAADVQAVSGWTEAELFAGCFGLRRVKVLAGLCILRAGEQRLLCAADFAKAQH